MSSTPMAPTFCRRCRQWPSAPRAIPVVTFNSRRRQSPWEDVNPHGEFASSVTLRTWDGVTPNDMVPPSWRRVLLKPTWERECASAYLGEDVIVPLRRADGWIEVELGELYNEGGGDHGEVSMCWRETNPGTINEGFTIRRIDIRCKQAS
jgi:hypothetical protein